MKLKFIMGTAELKSTVPIISFSVIEEIFGRLHLAKKSALLFAKANVPYKSNLDIINLNKIVLRADSDLCTYYR